MDMEMYFLAYSFAPPIVIELVGGAAGQVASGAILQVPEGAATALEAVPAPSSMARSRKG